MKKIFCFLLLVFNFNLISQEVLSDIFSNKTESVFKLVEFNHNTHYVRFDNNGVISIYKFDEKTAIYTRINRIDMKLAFDKPVIQLHENIAYIYNDQRVWKINLVTSQVDDIELDNCLARIGSFSNVGATEDEVLLTVENFCLKKNETIIIKFENKYIHRLTSQFTPIYRTGDRLFLTFKNSAIPSKISQLTVYNSANEVFTNEALNFYTSTDPVSDGEFIYYINQHKEVSKKPLSNLNAVEEVIDIELTSDNVFLKLNDTILIIENLDGSTFLDVFLFDINTKLVTEKNFHSPNIGIELGTYNLMTDYDYYIDTEGTLVVNLENNALMFKDILFSNRRIIQIQDNNIVIIGANNIYLYDHRLQDTLSILPLHFKSKDKLVYNYSSGLLSYILLPILNDQPTIGVYQLADKDLIYQETITGGQYGITGEVDIRIQNGVIHFFNEEELYVFNGQSFKLVNGNNPISDYFNILYNDGKTYLFKKVEIGTEVFRFFNNELVLVVTIPFIFDVSKMVIEQNFIFLWSADNSILVLDLNDNNLMFFDSGVKDIRDLVYYDNKYFLMKQDSLSIYDSKLNYIESFKAGFLKSITKECGNLLVSSNKLFEYNLLTKKFDVKPSILLPYNAPDIKCIDPFLVFFSEDNINFSILNTENYVELKTFKVRDNERYLFSTEGFMVFTDPFNLINIYHFVDLGNLKRKDFNFNVYGLATGVALYKENILTMVFDQRSKSHKLYTITTDLSSSILVFETKSYTNQIRMNNLLYHKDDVYAPIGDQLYKYNSSSTLSLIKSVKLSNDNTELVSDRDYIYYLGLDIEKGRQLMRYNTQTTNVSDEIPKDKNLNLYPNPTSNVLNIKNIDGIDQKNYRIYNSIGTLVLSGLISEIIDVHSLDTGVYYFLLENYSLGQFVKI